MRKNLRTSSLLYVVVGGATAFSTVVHGGAFQVTEFSAEYQGYRNAGIAANASTAATVFTNPAGMTLLPGSQLATSFHVIVPTFDFSNEDSTNALGGAVTGQGDEDGGKVGLVPNVYLTQQVNDRWAVGLGINAPYGLLTDYNNDWIGRYHAVRSELISVNFNPAVAVKLTDQLSFGFGVNAIYLDVTLTNALDFGALAFLGGAPGVTPSTRAFDGEQKLVGDDLAYGWNMGLLYEASPSTRFGIAFRSDIDATIAGEARIRGNPRLAAVDPRFGSRQRDANVDFTVPGTFTVGAFHQVTDKWDIMAGVTWTHWSTFKEIRVKFDDGGPDAVQPENYDNAVRWSVGTQYRFDKHWTVRAGFEYDESPVDNDDRTPRIPDQDRYWLAVGVGYNLSDSFSFDLAYSHIFVPDFSIDDTEVNTGSLAGAPVGNTLAGDYEADANIFSAQITWKF